MIFTNAQIFESVQALSQAKDEKGVLGYAVAVNLRKLSTAPEAVEYNRKRDELLAEYGTQDPDAPGQFNLTREAAAAFYTALEPFAKIETDLQVVRVRLADFCGGNLTSAQMYALDWMVKEE